VLILRLYLLSKRLEFFLLLDGILIFTDRIDWADDTYENKIYESIIK